LVERWDGGRWSIQPAVTPRGTRTVLNAVSCTSGSACTAVGSYTNSADHGLSLVERWNGSSWSIQPTVNPLGARKAALNGVSCTSRGACTAVGSFTDGDHHSLPLIERRNGRRWSLRRPPQPAGSTDSALSGVSCTSKAACIVVGGFTNAVGEHVTLAERSHRSSGWSVQPTPNVVVVLPSQLTGVSCTSTTACTAVGSYGSPCFECGAPLPGLALVERWNGSSWSSQASPTPVGNSFLTLSGVSCATATACAAVGREQSVRNVETPVAEAWDGTGWTLQTTPNPATSCTSGAGSTCLLNSVSCTSAAACTAVGSYFDSVAKAEKTLAERWDGTSWTIQNTPEPSGADGASLTGVSCTSPTACTAVGSAGGQALIERWDGTSWTIQAAPSPAQPQLNAVSCTSAAACTTVGSYTDSTGNIVSLAERWDGSSWTIQSTPNPAGPPQTGLFGVSCTSATSCIAVGAAGNGIPSAEPGISPLAEIWDGTSWTIQNTPEPSGAIGMTLSGVSCTSATSCTAVGQFSTSPGNTTIPYLVVEKYL
jgi:hypothetical protein